MSQAEKAVCSHTSNAVHQGAAIAKLRTQHKAEVERVARGASIPKVFEGDPAFAEFVARASAT